MATVVFPLLVLIVGLIFYGMASNPKVLKVAEFAIFIGLFFVTAELAHLPLHWPSS